MNYRRILVLLLVLAAVATVGALFSYTLSMSCLCPLILDHSGRNELVTLAGSRLNSPTNVTLYLGNAGNLNFSLSSYSVIDSGGNQYSRSNWTIGPSPQTGSTAPNAQDTALILIGPTCGTSCANTGQAFTFVSGRSYEIKIVTSRSNVFQYGVTA